MVALDLLVDKDDTRVIEYEVQVYVDENIGNSTLTLKKDVGISLIIESFNGGVGYSDVAVDRF